MKIRTALQLGITWAGLSHGISLVWGFDVTSHAAMTSEAIAQSHFSRNPYASSLIKDLGILDPAFLNSKSYLDIGPSLVMRDHSARLEKVFKTMKDSPTGLTIPDPYTLTGWVMQGAIREDDNNVETPDGDGAPDYTASSLASANPIFTIAAGYVRAKVTVKNGGSVVYTFTQVLYAYSAVQKYLLLKGVYTGMVDRLKAGNSSTALNFFLGHARPVYEDIFNKLGADLATYASQLGDVVTINMSDQTAEIVISRDVAGGKQAFMIYMLLGEDGIWRIESM
jgi:hypothetical protein